MKQGTFFDKNNNNANSQDKQVKRTRSDENHANSEELKKMKVLIVDDTSSNHATLKFMLNKLFPDALEFQSSNDGSDAIERITKGEKFDFIFMDSQMPTLGQDTINAIRQHEKEKELPANYIITFTTTKIDGNKIMLDGSNDSAFKPPIKNDLETVVKTFKNQHVMAKQPDGEPHKKMKK